MLQSSHEVAAEAERERTELTEDRMQSHAYISGGPIGPTLEPRVQTPPPQSLGEGSDVGRASPEDTEHMDMGSPKGTPGRLQPISTCHTAPSTPPKLPIPSNLKSFNISSFGLASLSDLASASPHCYDSLYCAQNVFPTRATSADSEPSPSKPDLSDLSTLHCL